MSYFIPRPRNIKLLKGSLEVVRWPAESTIKVKLTPAEAFGPSACEDIRTSVITQPQVSFNANNGRTVAKSDQFLPPISMARRIGMGSMEFQGDVLTLVAEVGSFEELTHGLVFAEQYIPTFLSLTTGIFVRAEEITGTIGSDLEFRYELTAARILYQQADEQFRNILFSQALDLSQMDNERYLVACMYFQQALRFSSPHEITFPTTSIAEIALNLAKAVEILFNVQGEQELNGKKKELNDKIRSACASLGYSREDIESQIVPLMLMRNQFDIAHPVGNILSSDDVTIMQDYVYRAIHNVQNLLLRVGQRLSTASGTVAYFPEMSAQNIQDKKTFVEKLAKYLQAPGLPNERPVGPDCGSIVMNMDFHSGEARVNAPHLASSAQTFSTYKKTRSNFRPGITMSLGRPDCNAAIVLYNSGQFAEAVERFQKALAADPNLAPAALGLGLCFYQMGRPENSLIELNRAIAIDPTLTSAHFIKALALIMKMNKGKRTKSDLSEAMESLDRVLLDKPNNTIAVAKLIEVMHHLFRYKVLNGQWNDAMMMKRKQKIFSHSLASINASRSLTNHAAESEYEIMKISI